MEVETRYPFLVHAETRQGGRQENQDTCAYADTEKGLLVLVCDGMGGGPAGKCASMTAANAIVGYICDHEGDAEDAKVLVVEAIRQGDDAIRAKVAEDGACRGMGTTVAMLYITEKSAIVAHVGDSRVYQLRKGKKVFRTFDHSYVFSLVCDGKLTEEEARVHERSNVITRALGANIQYDEGEFVEVDVEELAYDPGDRFMLCSDGVWGMFPEKELISMAERPKSVVAAIDNIAVKVDEHGFDTGGGHDNLTIAIVETKNYSKLKEKMSKRTKRLFVFLILLLIISIAGNVFLLFREDIFNYLKDYISIIEKLVN